MKVIANQTTARRALVKIAEGLWDALKQMNRDDEHGVRSLAVQADDLPYGQTWNALRGVVAHLVDGDPARRDRVMYLLIDAYETVTNALTYEAEERAAAEQAAARDADQELIDAALAADPATVMAWLAHR